MNDHDYRLMARGWLAQHAPDFSGAARKGLSFEQDLALGRAWQRRKFEAGYGAITLPEHVGGANGSELQKIIFSEEEGRYDLPTAYFSISLGMPIPMMVRYGTPEQVDELVKPSLMGDAIWCQLFSEPAAGSDLAALRTVATRQGDSWHLSGQKLWTSWAQISDYAIVVARTDPTLAKHAGLSFFFLNMKSPGVTVRPVKLLTGHSDVNEVFLDDVIVPDAQRMGKEGEGFRLVIETLMMERYAVTDDAGYGPSLAQFVALMDELAADDAERRAAVADAYAEQLGLRMIHKRALDALAAGREPGPEGSIRKLKVASTRQKMSRLAMDMMGSEGLLLEEGATIRSSFALSWLDSPTLRIAGGTDEILRNTIAERILGLPQDHRPDKGRPFKDA
ncbi:MAG: acyl-CoA dehydrogenase family protein [Sphingorhabdus sp.]